MALSEKQLKAAEEGITEVENAMQKTKKEAQTTQEDLRAQISEKEAQNTTLLNEIL